MLDFTNEKLVADLEELSQSRPDLLIRLTGILQVARNTQENLELLIFRGFSSSTTHPTSFDPNQSAVPNQTILDRGEILQSPLIPNHEKILFGPVKPSDLLKSDLWIT